MIVNHEPQGYSGISKKKKLFCTPEIALLSTKYYSLFRPVSLIMSGHVTKITIKIYTNKGSSKLKIMNY